MRPTAGYRPTLHADGRPNQVAPTESHMGCAGPTSAARPARATRESTAAQNVTSEGVWAAELGGSADLLSRYPDTRATAHVQVCRNRRVSLSYSREPRCAIREVHAAQYNIRADLKVCAMDTVTLLVVIQ